MKKWMFVLIATLLTQNVLAQEEAETEEAPSAEAAPVATAKKPAVRARENWGFSLSTLQWDETLRVQDGITSTKVPANYNAITVTIMKEITYYRWGWSAGAFIGAGRANGGSDADPYLSDKVAFTTYGISPRVFYRLSGRINAGVTGMLFYKNIDWPKETSTQTIDSGRSLNVTGIADLNIRLFQKWDFYTGIGPLTEGSTLWKIGVNYRF
ncbi:hypothetical protein Bb109J_c2339 [Bdellovibrio bacteriovorus]|uniref:hypothetical protein n=1 Tax=Bdellovibrio bacteriovorus TaxID=959 RepID=UPI00045BFAC3|nr:hypothetical protein [Bdellovibrio bacteriovorus]AHZ85032.1 hypothetical protein EP01_08775 [Bdellovibrio bacteriovorus]BEV68919.1 hypothetical protein Bb109J_c2339 [Bdellovibrio bacteriovorus]